MSNVVFVFYRDKRAPLPDTRTLTLISRRLQPDNITYPPPKVHSERGLVTAIINPISTLPIFGPCVCLGGFFGDSENWHQLGTPKPDGSYALYRASREAIELHTDALSSRTIWYYIDKEKLIAASSQRAIIMLLGNYSPNEKNYPWMLSTGRLKYLQAWDTRIQRLPLDSVLTLNRNDWRLHVRSKPFEFTKFTATDAEHETRFSAALRDTMQRINADMRRWLVPISGGYDSRGIALGLSARNTINTITWGTADSVNNTRGDAWLAEKVSRRLKSKHRFYTIDSSDSVGNVGALLDLFLRNSECQLDNIAGYMDGFSLWQDIYESGYFGVIRGDVAIGASTFRSTRHAYATWGLFTLDEYKNTGGLKKAIAAWPQKRHPSLAPLAGESMVEFTQRTIGTYYVTMISVPLNDLKTAYCEVLTPLLSQHVHTAFHQLPAHLMASRTLYKKIIRKQLPEVEIARQRSLENKISIVNSAPIATHILEYLHAQKQAPKMPIDVYNELLGFIESHFDPKQSTKKPGIVQRAIRKARYWAGRPTLSLDPMLLGFRLYIILRSHEIFSEDAKTLLRR